MTESESQENPAVRTTIVGGRPPGSGKPLGDVPRGIEILVRKASVDPRFRHLLLEERSRAASHIDLTLDPSESAMLDAIPREHLEAIIGRTRVTPGLRSVFLGYAAAVMLAALGCDGQKAAPEPPRSENKVEDIREGHVAPPPKTITANPGSEAAAEGEGTLYGTVIYKATGKPASDVEITLVGGGSEDNPLTIKGKTDAKGKFELKKVPSGTYKVHTTLDGFYQEVKSNVIITAGSVATVNFVLRSTGSVGLGGSRPSTPPMTQGIRPD